MQKAVVVGVLLTAAIAGCATAPSQMPVPIQPIAKKMPTAPRSARGPAPSPTHDTPVRRPVVTKRKPQVRSESNWLPAGRPISSRWETIVIHHSATRRGGAASFDRNHQDKGWDELGYHFVIGNGTDTPDGMVEVGSRWRKQKHGAHCKTPDNYYNEHGIGICLVGDFTRSGPTRAQLRSLVRLVAFLMRACDLPPSKVTVHSAVTKKTACPGTRFSLAGLRRAVARTTTASSMP